MSEKYTQSGPDLFGRVSWVGDYWNSWSLSREEGFRCACGNHREGGNYHASLECVASGDIPREAFSYLPDAYDVLAPKLISHARFLLNEPPPVPPSSFPLVEVEVCGYEEGVEEEVTFDFRDFMKNSNSSHSKLIEKLLKVDELPEGPMYRYYRDIGFSSEEIARMRLWDNMLGVNIKRCKKFSGLVDNGHWVDIKRELGDPFALGSRTVTITDYGVWRWYLESHGLLSV